MYYKNRLNCGELVHTFVKYVSYSDLDTKARNQCACRNTGRLGLNLQRGQELVPRHRELS